MKKAAFIWKLLFMAVIIVLPMLVIAQFDPGGGFDDDVDDTGVPFDGGISLLVAAAIGYGVKKAMDKRKADKNQPADL